MIFIPHLKTGSDLKTHIAVEVIITTVKKTHQFAQSSLTKQSVHQRTPLTHLVHLRIPPVHLWIPPEKTTIPQGQIMAEGKYISF